ncbi:heat shock protein 70 kDa [Trifolium pratense]|uniref:Heat shock protein 70 kDa n=1 Tax=Trifolium pratense TaxID=57577 RepID=A0A2K3M7H7_TRIPR|nr:heat shock protein 70 kDa [Trifolium pratense]PNX86747.1 heat shock protein 70 kDa [Trifolium pratense]
MQEFFKGKELCKSINPDEAVAYGAAVQAALLCEDVKNVPKLVLQDVTPLSLGTSIQGDIMSVVIPRNTCIPVKMVRGYVTTIDNQFSTLIEIYEGERTRASDNNLLGSFILTGIPPAPRGSHSSNVCFAIDENGILTVSAKNNSSGNSNEITITNYKERLSAEEINKLIQAAKNYHVEDKKFLRKAEAVNALDDYIYKMRSALKKNINLRLSSEEIKKIEDAIKVATGLVDENENHHYNDIDVLENHLKELKNMFGHIIAKTG